jgi:chemotaxis signal transduction protein
VPLVDLGLRLGHGPTEAGERTRVLLAGSREAPFGFVVESVDYLEWSAWRSREPGVDPLVAGKVSLPRLGTQGVLPVLDLATLGSAVSA